MHSSSGGISETRSQSFIIYVLLFTAIIAMVYFTVNQQNAKVVDIPINQLAADIREGKVKSITEDDSRLQITYKNNDQKSSTKILTHH